MGERGQRGAGLFGIEAGTYEKWCAPERAQETTMGMNCRAMFQGRARCEVPLEEGGRPHHGPHESANGLDPERGGMVQWLPGDRIVGFAVTRNDVPPPTPYPVLIPRPKLKLPFIR